MSFKVAFFRTQPYEREPFDAANLPFGFDISYFEEPLTLKTAHLAKGSDAICAFVNDPCDAKIIDLLSSYNIGLIALRCTGHDKVDLQAAKGKIKVVNVPEYSPYSVAEFAVGLILCLNRKYHISVARTRSYNFSIDGLLGFDLHGKTAGLIGTGKIGAVAATILKGFGMRVLAYDIDPSQVKKTSAEYADLPTLYRESDIISLHAPLTKDNHHLIDRKAIDQMKKGVMLINTGRGGLVNTRDLIEGLESGKIGSAALDVYENESEIFYKDLSKTPFADELLKRLLEFSQVIVTSHEAYFTREATSNIAKTTLESIKDFSQGKELKHEIRA